MAEHEEFVQIFCRFHVELVQILDGIDHAKQKILDAWRERHGFLFTLSDLQYSF